jgi:pyrimidine operon attenuation protein / uracil phosphoribosyltransferase
MSAAMRTIVDSKQMELMIERLCYQLIENHDDFKNTAVIGLQPRGGHVAKRIHSVLQKLTGNSEIKLGLLDATFNRDDLRRRTEPILPSDTVIDFQFEEMNLVLVDDVLFTGRTIRAGLDAMLAYGRPSSVELLVIVDRRLSRQLPIEPKYVGTTIDTIVSERVNVNLVENGGNDTVTLYSDKQK